MSRVMTVRQPVVSYQPNLGHNILSFPFPSFLPFFSLSFFPFLSFTSLSLSLSLPFLPFYSLFFLVFHSPFPFLSFPFIPSPPFLSSVSSRLSDECVQSGRAGSMQSVWLAGCGCHYSPVCIDTRERERIKDFKHAYLAMSLTAMLLVYFFLPLSLLLLLLPPPHPQPRHPLPSLLLISDAASQFNGHYDQIPGRDRGGSE